VAEVARAIARLYEREVPVLRIRGELSNVSRAASGHWYFTLKDDAAALRAVMFRNRSMGLSRSLRDGDSVEVTATLGFYEPRGDTQLNVESIRWAGQGTLFERFMALRDALQQAGVFDADRKQPIPRYPRAIGVISSLQAAALQDVLSTLARRVPHLPVVVYPAPVQGGDAPALLRSALQTAIARAEVEVLLLVRGGGSLEDLWAFNDEALVRAVADCPIPIISGVGHETDVTLCDFAADVRAPTPTAAAEMAAEPRDGLMDRLAGLTRRLVQAQQRRLEVAAQQLDQASLRLVSPQQMLELQAGRLAALRWRLEAAPGKRLLMARQALAGNTQRLMRQLPDAAAGRERLQALRHRHGTAMARQLRDASQQLTGLAGKLQALSPHATVSRGYALVTDAQGVLLRAPSDAPAGTRLVIELADGRLAAESLGDLAGQAGLT
jgi:exodeoxyribonuclease VII large subunit